jgi:hypothetical protein
MCTVAVGGTADTLHDVTYISSGSPVVDESSASVAVRIHRGEHGLGDATVYYGTKPGEADAGQDYETKKGNIVLAAPRDDKAVRVDLLDDDEVEGVETFSFTLERAEGGTLLRTPKTATVTIADDDGPSRISFATSTFSNFENRGGVAITLVRSGDATAEATVDLASADGAAIAGQDYEAFSGTVTFSPGDRAEVVGIPMTNDTEEEATEDLSVVLQNTVGAELTTPSDAVVNILDDDSDSSDTKAPVSQFHKPRDGEEYRSNQLGSLHIITSDDASGVAVLKGALRKRLRSSGCAWYTGKRFVRGSCDNRRWVDLEVRNFVYWRLRVDLAPTNQKTGIRSYTAYALSTDEAGNAESKLKAGRNKNTFYVR